MTEKIPSYLKLVREEPPDRQPSRLDQAEEIAPLLDAFEDVTGWALRFEPSKFLEPWSALDGSQEAAEDAQLGSFVLEAPAQRQGAIPLELHRARRMAASLTRLLSELDQAREALWRREAELAAGVPVTASARDKEHLASRLEAVLKGGARAVGCQAAAVYLLDEATTELKLRSSWGLSPRRLLDSPRPLEGAVADLEALLGHAVVLEDTSLTPSWQAPEHFSSAVCVPLASSSELLGTLWFFCREARDYSPDQTNVMEIIAGRIAAELQRAVLLAQCVQSKQLDHQLYRAVAWQVARRPSVAPLLDGWEIAGWADGEGTLHGGFYDWCVPADGQLAIALGRADGLLMEAVLTSAALQGAMRAHSVHAHDAAQMVNRLNETVWNGCAGGQFAALCYALIAAETGTVECCRAGNIEAILLHGEQARRLTLHQPPLGNQPGNPYTARRFRMLAGDLLVLSSGGCQDPRDDAKPRSLQQFVQALVHNRSESPTALVAALCAADALGHDSAGGTQTLLIVRRK